MSNIYLDKEDVIAIARQREYDVPEKTLPQKITEWLSAIICLGFTGVAAALSVLHEAGSKRLEIMGYLMGVAIFSGAIFLILHHKNEEPLRKAVEDFIRHWEKTGEIKPRWPGRLKKNQDDGGKPYQSA